MKDLLFLTAVIFLVGLGGYRAGYYTAQTHYEVQATLAAQVVKEAVSRASDALYGLAETVSTNDRADDAKLKEIEDAAAAAGAVCTVPVERLRGLDAIAN